MLPGPQRKFGSLPQPAMYGGPQPDAFGMKSSMTTLTESNGRKTQTPAAARMRHYRARRAAGSVIVTFRLFPGGVALLADLGWLSAEDLRKPQAVRKAFSKFVNAAAAVGITPVDGRRVTRNN
jgi:hypothetical protein